MGFRRSAILALAFTTLVLVIVVSTLVSWRKNTGLLHQLRGVHRVHKEAGDALTKIRSNVFLSAVLLRDYLLDAETDHPGTYKAQFQVLRKQTYASFAALEATGLDKAQKQAVDLLMRQIEAYWAPIDVVLQWTSEQRAAGRAEVLRRRVGKRQEIFNLASQVEQLLETNLDRERTRIQAAEAEYRLFSIWGAAAAILLAAGIAVVAHRRMARLERQSGAAASELRRLSAQLRTTQEEERRSLSRELHDQVGQMLTGLRMELAALEQETSGSPDASARFRSAKGTVEQLLRSVRNTAMLLRPSMLDDLGLAPAVRWHVREFARVSGIAAEAEVDSGLDQLPDKHRTGIYRVVQEALTNCARHSHASRVAVEIAKAGGVVTVRVSDDGQGFDVNSLRGPGLGMLGMEERIRELNGILTVSSEPGGGTKVEARIPLPFSDDQVVEEGYEDTHRGRSRHHTDGSEAAAGKIA